MGSAETEKLVRLNDSLDVIAADLHMSATSTFSLKYEKVLTFSSPY